MRTNSSLLLATLNKVTISNLAKEVKETIAFDVVPVSTKSFTTADLWSIRRRSRSAVSRRSHL